MAGPRHGATAGHLTQIPTELKHGRISVLCFAVLGCGMLASASAGSITADAFSSMLPNSQFLRAVTACFLPLMLLVTGLLAAYAGLMPSIGWRRITSGYALNSISAVITVLVGRFLLPEAASSTSATSAATGLLLVAAGLAAAGSGLSVSTVLGEAAYMPESCTRASVIGMSAPGLVMSVMHLVIKAALPAAPAGSLRASMQACWVLAAVLSLASLLVYWLLLPRLDVVRHHRELIKAEHLRADIAFKFSEAPSSSIISVSCFGSFVSRASLINISMTGPRLQVLRSPSMLVVLSASNPAREEQERQEHQQQVLRGQSAGLLKLGSMAGSEASRSSNQSTAVSSAMSPPPFHHAVHMQQLGAQFAAQLETNPIGGKSPHAGSTPSLPPAAVANVGSLCWTTIIKLNKSLYSAVLMVSMVTLATFPAAILQVEDHDWSSWAGTYPLALSAVYHACDFLSRCVPGCGFLFWPHVLLLLAAARLMFAPLLAVVLITCPSAVAVIVLVALVGATSGYLFANIFAAAPRGLSPSAAELAAMINVLVAVAGATVGALVGWCWGL